MIDFALLEDTSEPITEHIAVCDVEDVYTLTNVRDDDESSYNIGSQLYYDYTLYGINYRAYIQKDMDARLFTEIRKSVVIRKAMPDGFLEETSKCTTIEEVVAVRMKYGKQLEKCYNDDIWQIQYLAMLSLNEKWENVFLDFESCFEDGDASKQMHPETVWEAFVNHVHYGFMHPNDIPVQ